MTQPERIHGRAGLTVIAGLACAFALSGCPIGGGGSGKTAVRFLKGPAEKALAEYPKVPLTPAGERFSARSVLLKAPESRPLLAVSTEAEAAGAVKKSATLEDAAQSSAANVDRIVSETTSDGAAQTKIKDCLKGGTRTAVVKVAADAGKDLKEGQRLSIDIEPKVVPVFSACLQKAYPEAAPVTKALGTALMRARLAPSDEVSETAATAQDYVDWLLYSAELAAAADVDAAPADPEVNPSKVEASVDALLVRLFHAHRGRLAVRRKDWRAAIANRTDVIQELGTLDVAPALEPSRKRLLRAMETSLESDRKHAARCGGGCAAGLDRRATAQKQAFVREYHPYFKRKYKGRLDHRDF